MPCNYFMNFNSYPAARVTRRQERTRRSDSAAENGISLLFGSSPWLNQRFFFLSRCGVLTIEIPFFRFLFLQGDSYLHPWATRNAIIFLDVFDKSRQNWCHFSAAGNRLWGIYQHPIHPPRVTYHRPPSAPGWPQWPAGIGAKIGRPKIVPVPIFNL